MTEDPVATLTALGFTTVEAKIYTYLVQNSPATGYRISKALGMPLSNTYKAVEALQSRGALLAVGEPRSYRSVPVEELLNRMEREFLQRRAEAKDALANLEKDSTDPGVYQLHTHAQVLERAHTMLAQATQVAMLDLFPTMVEALRDAIEAAATRGVLVGVVVYQPTSLRGVEVVLDPQGENVLKRWPGDWLNVAVDGAQLLVAFLKPGGEGIYQAVWSNSPYVSWVYHSLQAWALTGPALEQQILEGASLEQLQASTRHFRRFHALESPGYLTVMRTIERIADTNTNSHKHLQGDTSDAS